MSKESLLEDLNPQQREALLYTEGPLLILAGAGSGKTRVISYKFSYLIKAKRYPPKSILTVTFTNKAAREMRERICALAGQEMNGLWLGTFHSQCCRILRRDIHCIGFRPDFTIYDEDDQCNLIRHILRELRIHEALYKGVAARISSLKSSLTGPEEFLSKGDGYGFDEKLAKVYIRYQDELKRCNALDFDDLLGYTIMLFEKCPEVLKRYQSSFRYILIDEFQDTNYAQYELLKIIGFHHRNISVVGDDDQSIYRFRGADVTNVFRFENEFPGTKVIRLEQNYRSTQNILDVASAVISKNPIRKPKKLWTVRGGGEMVYHCLLINEDEEARHIAKTIRELYLKGSYEYRDFSVLYRVGSQSRAVEMALREEGIPYRIMGGLSFYQRKEIKDLIAFARLIMNHDDNVSLRRVVNIPSKGLDSDTLTKIEQEAKRKGTSIFEAMKSLIKTHQKVGQKKSQDTWSCLDEFIRLIEQLHSRKYKTAADMLRDIVEKTGYMGSIDEERVQHINELISSAAGASVHVFLENVSLFTSLDDTTRENAVSLMTLHSVKGLEFPVVFVTGLEEGVLPYFRAMETTDEIQEERRLFYVGMTRAKDILWLTGASRRKFYTKVQNQEPSRFLLEIPRHCCECIEKTNRTQIACAVAQDENDIGKRLFPYVAGCRVKHPKWGVGVVRDCYGDGEEQKVMVNFPNIGIKKLVLRFANLEKI